MILTWRDFTLDFTKKTYIMGVLNVTPDSFSDGGLYLDKERAVEHARRLTEEGADIIDIGGESTRPGSEPVSLKEELRRIIPVVQAISKEIKIPISIDTYKAEVARRALDAGASMVNDISGLRFDSEMSQVVAQYDVPVIITHIKGKPRDMQQSPAYEALIPEIMNYLKTSMQLVESDNIIVDPGIGFGKTFQNNLEIIKNLRKFTLLKKPIAIGVSRKAFIGKILGSTIHPEGVAKEMAERSTERFEGTAAAVAISIFNGANIVRVHDVKKLSKVAKVADAIKRNYFFQK